MSIFKRFNTSQATTKPNNGGDYVGTPGEITYDNVNGLRIHDGETPNGSELTGAGGGSNYGDGNVAAYLPTYTGNVAAAAVNTNLVAGSGPVDIVAGTYTYSFDNAGHITGTDANVEISAGNYTWTFDNAGNVTGTGDNLTLTANTAVWTFGQDTSVTSPNGDKQTGKTKLVAGTGPDQGYASGGGAHTIWTATSANVIAAVVNVRAQFDYNRRTELFTVTFAKDGDGNFNSNVSNQFTSNVAYGLGTVSGTLNGSSIFQIDYTDPHGNGNGFTFDVVEYNKTW